MIIAAQFSFNNGKEEVQRRFPDLLPEVKAAIEAIDAAQHKIKESKEKTKMGQMLYSPVSINNAFKTQFAKSDWKAVRVTCDYETAYYEPGYAPRYWPKRCV